MENYFGGKLFTPTDEEVLTLTRGFSLDEVCRFHREAGGVVCNQRSHSRRDCERCGWNPRVQRQRIARFKGAKEEEPIWP